MNYMSQGIFTKEDRPQLDINEILLSPNLIEELSEEHVNTIFRACDAGLKIDLDSRDEYDRQMDKWEKHVLLALERKTFPWENASNVMFPLIAIACIQFNARAYPALVPNNKQVVNAQVIGKDPDGAKDKRARRIGKFHSWQLQNDMPDWEEGMDKLLLMLPAYGNVFKKNFWSGIDKKQRSYLISPKNLIVNLYAQSLEKAPRVSERLQAMTERDVKEKINEGIWAEVEQLTPDEGSTNETPFYNFIEQHCYLDLDGDGYEEPYIVTFHPPSGYVARIVSNFFPEDITQDEKGKVIRIKKTNYYTKYAFIPALGERFYDLGFGELLFSTNESVNTLINQLIDSGTLNNLQSGFIGKGIKMPKGDSSFRPGEWKSIPTMGDDVRKNVVPLPTKEPSNVLFQLLGLLISSGKELASVAEIFTGKLPGQNTPATTTMASIEQGMKVFTAIYKRVYRSLEKEIKLVYKINKIYLSEQEYLNVLDDQEANLEADFDDRGYDICPSADPSVSSQTEAIVKSQALLELIPLGINPAEALYRHLQAMEIPAIEKLIPGLAQTGELPEAQQQPDPKMVEMQMKQQADAEQNAAQLQMKQQEQALDMQSKEAQNMMDIQHKATMNALDVEAKQASNRAEKHKQEIFIAAERAKAKEKKKSESKT